MEISTNPGSRRVEIIAAELFARRADCLPFPDGLLYVGTSMGLRARDHLACPHSGFSTLRRSLGALLKERLRLEAGPRAPGPSATNRRNYRFLGTGEQDLTRWMRQHLVHACCALSPAEVGGIEAGLIRHLRPPLNLKGWNNPQAPRIRERRDRCVAEASGRPRSSPWVVSHRVV